MNSELFEGLRGHTGATVKQKGGIEELQRWEDPRAHSPNAMRVLRVARPST